MPAAATPFSDLFSHRLVCSRDAFEQLDEEQALVLLARRFRLLIGYGWDWSSALLLASDVEIPADEAGALAPPATPLRLAAR